MANACHVVISRGARTAEQQEDDESQLGWHLQARYSDALTVIHEPPRKRIRLAISSRETAPWQPAHLETINRSITRMQKRRRVETEPMRDFHDPICSPMPVLLDFHHVAVRPQRDPALDLDLESFIAPPLERSYRFPPEEALNLASSVKLPGPKPLFKDPTYCESIINERGRRGMLIMPIAGDHPYASTVGDRVSRPKWEQADDGPLGGKRKRLELDPLRLYTLWNTMDRLGETKRLGVARIAFVREPGSVYILIESSVDRFGTNAAWLRSWTKDPKTGDRFMDGVALAWIDLPIREGLFYV